MSIVVTGATGHLGRLVVEQLLERGVPAAEIMAAGRNIDKIKDLADHGVRIRAIDFTRPETLHEAFAGAEKVMFVSGSDAGARAAQHRNVIGAAEQAGVGLLVYTSIANADRATTKLASDHQATEAALRESHVPYAVLRNSWYIENYTGQLGTYLEHGAVFGSSGEGRVSGATRADYAAAAAVVLAGEDQAGRVYELGGDEAFTLAGLARTISAVSGTDVTYRDLPEDDYARLLVSAGLPEGYATILADSERGVARGELFVDGGDLSRLIGRPTTTLRAAVSAAMP